MRLKVKSFLDTHSGNTWEWFQSGLAQQALALLALLMCVCEEEQEVDGVCVCVCVFEGVCVCL